MSDTLGQALDQLLADVAAKAAADPGQSYTAKLLRGGPGLCAKKLGEGTWSTLKDIHSAVVRSTHSWLRAQRNAQGAPIEAFRLLADVLRWTSGTTPATREDPERPGVRITELTLQPREERVLELRYEVRFPRNLQVQGLE